MTVEKSILNRKASVKIAYPTFVGGGHHLGDVHHERGVGVAVLDTDGAFVVVGTLVQHLHTVSEEEEGG